MHVRFKRDAEKLQSDVWHLKMQKGQSWKMTKTFLVRLKVLQYYMGHKRSANSLE